MDIVFVHWGRRAAGPRILLDVARQASTVPDLRVALSFARDAELAGELSNEGHSRLVMSTYVGRISFLMSLARLPLMVITVRRYLRSFSSEVTTVVIMESLIGSVVWPLASKGIGRYVYCLHDAQFHPGTPRILRRLAAIGRALELKRADLVVTFSNHVRQLVGDKHPNVTTVPHGTFSPLTLSPAFAAKELPTGKVRVGMIGRLEEYKGVDTFLSVAEQWPQTIPAKFVCMGEGPASKERFNDRTGAVDWRIGWLSEKELEEAVAGLDVILLPYKEASQSGIAAMAWTFGTPVVSSPVGGVAEQVALTGAGIVAEDNSAGSLISALSNLLRSDVYRHASEAAVRASDSQTWRTLIHAVTNSPPAVAD